MSSLVSSTPNNIPSKRTIIEEFRSIQDPQFKSARERFAKAIEALADPSRPIPADMVVALDLAICTGEGFSTLLESCNSFNSTSEVEASQSGWSGLVSAVFSVGRNAETSTSARFRSVELDDSMLVSSACASRWGVTLPQSSAFIRQAAAYWLNRQLDSSSSAYARKSSAQLSRTVHEEYNAKELPAICHEKLGRGAEECKRAINAFEVRAASA
jgi:hypothetical protein